MEGLRPKDATLPGAPGKRLHEPGRLLAKLKQTANGEARAGGQFLYGAQVADRSAGRERLGGADDALRVDAVMAIELGDRAGLAEMLDAERTGAVAVYRAKPAKCCRVPVDDGDDAAMGRNVGQQPLDMA